MRLINYGVLALRLQDLIKSYAELQLLFEKDENGKTTERARNAKYFDIRLFQLDSTQREVDAINELMAAWFSEYFESIQKPAVANCPDMVKLVDAMRAFRETASVPIPGMAGLFAATFEHCGRWLDHYEHFNQCRNKPRPKPDKEKRVREFADKLVKSKEYNQAVEDGIITEPFDWNGSLRDLVDWLQRGIIPTRMVSGAMQCQWTYADNLFSINGEKLSRDQLRDAYGHNKEY